jgi:hypothetical protein
MELRTSQQLPYGEESSIFFHVVFMLERKMKQAGAVVHAYNPSWSGGRDQEDHGSRPIWAKKS